MLFTSLNAPSTSHNLGNNTAIFLLLFGFFLVPGSHSLNLNYSWN